MADLAAVVAQLAEIARRVGAARRRLEEALPGFPSRASGADSGGPGGSGDSQPERDWPKLAGDPVLADLARLDDLIDTIGGHARALDLLVGRWAAPRPGVAGGDDNDWCVSCRRAGMVTPAERTGLCGWCRKFRYTEGTLPPVELLEQRRDGRRISQAQVDRAMHRRR